MSTAYIHFTPKQNLRSLVKARTLNVSTSELIPEKNPPTMEPVRTQNLEFATLKCVTTHSPFLYPGTDSSVLLSLEVSRFTAPRILLPDPGRIG